jgi:hypothetical protein
MSLAKSTCPADTKPMIATPTSKRGKSERKPARVTAVAR